MLTAADDATRAKMIGERSELVAIRSLASPLLTFHGVEQHQKLTLNPVFLHRPLFPAYSIDAHRGGCHN